MASTALLGLAFIKVNWDELGKDYVENFVPLVAECLRQSKAIVVSLPDLQTKIQESFGLELPLNSIDVILRRAAKRGFVELKNGVIYVNIEACNTLNLQVTQERVNAIHSRVTESLKRYISSKYQQDWTITETEKAIHDFLRDNSVSLIFSFSENSSGPDRSTHYSKTAYFVSAFLEELKSNDPSGLKDFEVLVQGNLLVNALYFPEPGRISKRFNRTKVYLDTPIIIFACGYAGKARAAPCLELLTLLSDYGARLCCFSGTIDEVRGILDACASHIQRGNLKDSYGPSMEYFIESGKTASDIELMSVRLTQKLNDMGITVDEKPSHDEIEYQIDEAGFETSLDKRIRYQNPKAKIHDIDCISSIARLRRGQETFQLEEAKAIFVTNNSALARVTRAFFQSESSPGAVAFCLTDYALGNLLWLKNPTKAPDLPLNRLLADAYATVQPTEQLWKKYLNEIAKLKENGDVTADQYYLLRHSLASKVALMDLTAGEEESFTKGTVSEVLEIATQNIQSETRLELQAEKDKVRAANSELAALKDKEFAQQQRLREVANKVARYIRKVLFPVIFVAVGIASYFTFPWTSLILLPAWLTSTLLILLFLLVVSNLIWGENVSTLMDRIEQFLAEAIRERLFSFFIQTNKDALPNQTDT